MLIDSHAHLNFEEFNSDWQQIIADCQENDVWLINVGAQLQTSKKAVEIADQYDKGIYAAIGLHPIHVEGSSFHPEKFNIKNYQDLIGSSKKVVAVGETGLDFFHDGINFTKQKEVFIQHINLAKEFDLPVILHARNSKNGQKDAYEEILKILKQDPSTSSGSIKGVIHCFGGRVKQALEFLNQGFYIGFTGVITFPKAEEVREVVSSLPLDSILVETDCPFLAPQAHRGQRNIPQYVKFVAEKVAEIKQIDYNKVVKQTSQNTINLFNLK